MPAIAAGVLQSGASFYWHLGDFRAIFEFDEDMQHQPEHFASPLDIIDYELTAWDDFISQSNRILSATLPVFLGIGNHETIPPKTREQYLVQFADWLDAPKLREQRLRDDPFSHKLTTYYHWIQNGVDFINLDNLHGGSIRRGCRWRGLKKLCKPRNRIPQVRTVVVGMHEALPRKHFRKSQHESVFGRH